MVAQSHGPDRNLLNRSHGAANFDVLAQSKCIVDQKEHTRHDVGHQFLCAEPDRETGDPSPSKKGCNVDPKVADRQQRENNRYDDL